MPSDHVQTVVEKLVPGGEGLARPDGQVCFIPGVLPGEHVKAPVIQRKKGWLRCGKPEILKSSPQRQQPFCALFGICGGCSWQHIPLQLQLETKLQFCREALRRQGGLSDENSGGFQLSDIQGQASSGRSTRVRIRPLVLSGGRAAFRAAGSHEPVPVAVCPMLSSGLNCFLGNEGRDKRARLAQGSQPLVFGGEQNFWVQGQDALACARVDGREFHFPPGVFFQSSLELLPELIRFALSGSGAQPVSGRTALDLYGGVGLFGSFLADYYERVIGVERDERSRQAWEAHVGKRGKFYAQTLEQWVRRRRGVSPDCIVVDPPRSGLGKTVVQGLIELSSPRLVYVSCNPVTQARDIKQFLLAGYGITAYRMFDLYPQTPHMETVCILEK